jgi:hypothetical protein
MVNKLNNHLFSQNIEQKKTMTYAVGNPCPDLGQGTNDIPWNQHGDLIINLLLLFAIFPLTSDRTWVEVIYRWTFVQEYFFNSPGQSHVSFSHNLALMVRL